jgi:uncharacterized protein YcnI
MTRPEAGARAGVAAIVAAALVLLPGTAAADVQVTASAAEAGARDVTVTFRVTNDDPAVPTTRLRVLLPTVRPLLGVAPGAPDGWTVQLSRAESPTPASTAGAPDAEIVTAIEWEGGTVPGDDAVAFPVAVSRLPDGAGPLRFRVVQTFADGTTAEWSDEAPYGAPAPEHPALVVPYTGTAALPAASGHHHGAATAADRAIPLHAYGSSGWTIGLVAGAAVVAAGVVGLGRRQRRRFAALRPGGAADDRRADGAAAGEPAAGHTAARTGSSAAP